MDTNTICQISGKHFNNGDEIFVVKPDYRFNLRRFFHLPKKCHEFYLCTEAFEKLYAENEKFRIWWNNNTRVIRMSADDAQEKYGIYWLDTLQDASCYTTFEIEIN